MKKIIAIVIGALVVLGGATGLAFVLDEQLQFKISGKYPIYELEGELAPDFTAPRVTTGDRVTLQSLRGKPTVLVFFATFCSVCELQMPELLEFTRTSQLADQTNVFLVNSRENARLPMVHRQKIAAEYLADHDIEIPAIVAPVAMQEAFELTAVPSLVVLDAEGTIRYVGLSDHSAEQIEELVRDAS